MSLVAWLAKRKIGSAFARLRKKVDPTADEHAQLTVFTSGLDALSVGMPDIGEEPGITITPVDSDAFDGDWVVYEGATNDKAVLLLHGGGYVWGTARHFHDVAARISRLTKARVLVPTYSLAPDHVYPTQLTEAMAAYDLLLADGVAGGSIALLGDSAGGNLAMALAQKIRAEKEDQDQPAALCLYSPWLDMTGTAPSVQKNASRDIMLTPDGIVSAGRYVAGDLPLDDPRLSPLFGDMAGLPPTHIQASNQEILLDDATRAAAALKQAGVETDLLIWKGLWHDFQQTARIVPEAKKALQKTADFMMKHWN